MTLTEQPKVTLIVNPRERFSYARQSLESIYANTEYPFNLVYVDVCSPNQTSNGRICPISCCVGIMNEIKVA